jgi:two-component system, NtrC family, nitrogen regulation sensor histidine kinase NtrY
LSRITTIRQFFFKQGYLLIISGWLFTFSFLLQYYWSYTSAPSQVQRALQRSVTTRQKDFAAILADTPLIRQLATGTCNSQSFEKLAAKDYFIFLAADSADGFNTTFWNTQTILPPNELWSRADGMWFEKLINGYYAVHKKTIVLKNGAVRYLMALVPVKWNYFVTTNDVQNNFAYLNNIEQYYSISDLAPTSLPITATDGTILFWLKQQRNYLQPLGMFTVITRLLAVLFLLLFVHYAASAIAKKYSFAAGLFFLVAFVVAARVCSYLFPVPLNFRQFELFDPAVYSSGNIHKSLGDLLINSFLLLWILLFISRHRKQLILFFPSLNRYVGLFIMAGLIFLSAILFGNITISLVSDSRISFNVANIFSLSLFSFASFVILGCLATNFFLVTEWLFETLDAYSDHKLYLTLFALTLAGLLYLTLTISSSLVLFHFTMLLWLLLIGVLLKSTQLARRFFPSGSKILFWLFFFSASLTALLVAENDAKEWKDRKRMAEKLSLQTDPAAETLLSLALNNFRDEFLLANFSRFNTSGGNQYLKDSLLNEHFSGYLNQFDSKIFTFSQTEQPLFNEDSISFNNLNTIYNLQSKPTTVRDWQYHEESFDQFYYLAKKEIKDSAGKVLGYVFILTSPRRYADEKFYPELFSKTYNLSPENTPAYAYAIYKNGKLVNSYNDYPFTIQLGENEIFTSGLVKKKNKGYTELWYAESKERMVVIARRQNMLLESITLFAYLFCIFLLMVAIFKIAEVISKTGLNRFKWKRVLSLTFRSQVHATIIGISIFSFLIIGVSTIFFFINRHGRTNKERLARTIQIMKSEVEIALQEHAVFDDMLKVYDDVSSAQLQVKVNRISEIHGVDVNIYDPSGNLRISSQPYYYNKGLLSRKAEPTAYYKLSNEQLVQTVENEKVGSRSYMSIYMPVRDEDGRTYAYINIPYFTSQNELKQEISSFLLTLINLNAFIFLIAGIIAFFVTGRITNSFSIISDKLKEIKLGKTNEAIVWTRDDEIGELVQEYNKMVNKLEDSATMLARSEREGAWREMARQVAHEIKNPLTPMKLSIQYLQKAIDNNLPDAKHISQNVAKTLVEQIDYLSNIASDFSSFANIGNPRMERVNIYESVKAVADLFAMSDTDDKVIFDEKEQEVEVMSDRTHLNRLFTNLIRNGLEAVPHGRQAIVVIRMNTSHDYVVIEFKDNGDGIPAELQQKIFYPNFTTKTSGTGLGLAICKGIVEQMKGDIWFTTQPNEGSKFFVKLPLVK